MEHGPVRIGDIGLTPHKPVKAASSQRAELIGKITDRLNKERDGVKFKKLTYAGVSAKLSHIKGDSNLYAFYRQCEEAKSFYRFFFWSLNPKNARSQPSGE
jgi:hypothetical protein